MKLSVSINYNGLFSGRINSGDIGNYNHAFKTLSGLIQVNSRVPSALYVSLRYESHAPDKLAAKQNTD